MNKNDNKKRSFPFRQKFLHHINDWYDEFDEAALIMINAWINYLLKKQKKEHKQ